MRFVCALVLSLLCAACSSLRDQAVPACPYCGDPAMRRMPDGSEVVVPRLRLAQPPAASPSMVAPAAVQYP